MAIASDGHFGNVFRCNRGTFLAELLRTADTT